MTENETAIKAFCEQFDPPLSYNRTDRINNQPVSDAFMTAFWLEKECIGITVLSYGAGQFKAYIEAAGKGDIAENAGRVIAKAFDMFKAKQGHHKHDWKLDGKNGAICAICGETLEFSQEQYRVFEGIAQKESKDGSA